MKKPGSLEDLMQLVKEGGARVVEPSDLDEELLAKTMVMDFTRVTKAIMAEFPKHAESPEESAALIIAMGAAFETFLIRGREVGAISADMEKLIRKHSVALAEIVMAAAIQLKDDEGPPKAQA